MLNRKRLMRTKTKRKIKKIVNYRQNNPFVTLQNIADQFSVTKGYVHRVLKNNNVPTIRAKRKRVQYCLHCKELSTTKVHLGKCHFEYYNPIIYCAVCRIPFHRKRAKIMNNHNRGYQMNYCSRACYYKRQNGPSKQSGARQ